MFLDLHLFKLIIYIQVRFDIEILSNVFQHLKIHLDLLEVLYAKHKYIRGMSIMHTYIHTYILHHIKIITKAFV